jgi:hypothetical protein
VDIALWMGRVADCAWGGTGGRGGAGDRHKLRERTCFPISEGGRVAR